MNGDTMKQMPLSPSFPARPSCGLTIVIGIASSGRRDILSRVIPHIARQTRKPDILVICAPAQDDVNMPALANLPFPVQFMRSEPGLCRQRNTIMDAFPSADILLFLDDDFLLDHTYIAELERVFLNNPDIDLLTGSVLADGATGPGITIEDGLALLRKVSASERVASLREAYSGYGCNMAVRLSTVRICKLHFDESLPFYGWLEDVDFSRAISRHGRVAMSSRLLGVHLGTKTGRMSGMRLGYSQIANPIYLAGKGTMIQRHALLQIARNLLSNITKAWKPEPWVDRRGRLKGNLLAVRDLLLGRLSPGNISLMD